MDHKTMSFTKIKLLVKYILVWTPLGFWSGLEIYLLGKQCYGAIQISVRKKRKKFNLKYFFIYFFFLNRTFSLLGSDDAKGFTYKNEFREVLKFHSTSNKALATLYLRKSLYTTLIQRSFWKFGDLLAYLGGLWNPIFFICLWLGKKFNEKACLVELANKLYSFIERSDEINRKETEMNCFVSHSEEKTQVNNYWILNTKSFPLIVTILNF